MQCHQWLDALAQKFIDEAIVEAETRSVDGAAARRQHAAPGDAEAVGLEAELAHQRHILRVAAIVVAGDVTGITVAHQTGGVREALPDTRRRTVGERGAFDLISRSRATPQEIRRESDGAPRRCYRTILSRILRKRFLSPGMQILSEFARGCTVPAPGRTLRLK